jgi:hypothetical protein
MAEKANAQIDLDLMQSVYAKIQLRVQQGDAPRIELIRAEADLLNVQKAAQAAALREDQARLQLRALVGPDLPEDFTLTGQLEAPLPLPALGVLQDQALAANPRWPAPAPRWSRPATGWIMRNRGVCPSSRCAPRVRRIAKCARPAWVSPSRSRCGTASWARCTRRRPNAPNRTCN